MFDSIVIGRIFIKFNDILIVIIGDIGKKTNIKNDIL